MADPEEIPMRERPTDEGEKEGEEDGRGTGETSFTEKERLDRLRDKDAEDNRGRDNPGFDWTDTNPTLTEHEIELELMNLDDKERVEISRGNYRKMEVLADLVKKEGMLEIVFKKRFRGTYGPNSKNLLMSTEISMGKRGDVTGLVFKDPGKISGSGVKAIVGVGKRKPLLSKNFPKGFEELAKKAMIEFEKSAEKAIVEFEKTAESVTYENIKSSDPDETITQEILDEVRDDTIDSTESDYVDATQTTFDLTFDEERESRGVIGGSILENDNTDEERIELLDVDIEHWEELAESEKPEEMEEGSEERQRSKSRKKFFTRIANLGKLQQENIRLKNNIRPEEEETLEIMEEAAEKSKMRTFEKLKKWAKENMLGLSAVAISTAGIITTIAMSTKTAAKAGGKALKGFAKSVVNVFKKLGPVFSGLASLAAAQATDSFG